MNRISFHLRSSLPIFLFCGSLLSGCSTPYTDPDKSAEGVILGGAWGTGVGAVVGNQVATAGMGAAVGSGFGAVAGLMTGISLDQLESNMKEQQDLIKDLSLKAQLNFEKLKEIQDTLDNQVAATTNTGVYQVYFDHDATNLKSGAITNLQTIAESMKQSLGAQRINVIGHTDDSGDKEHNKQISEARAKEVASYLSSRGVSMDQIKITFFGADRPLASNSTPEGRQLNRRVDVYLGG